MKTITIRELHNRTGAWLRKAADLGEIHVTDHGRTIAKIVPQAPATDQPYFAQRQVSPAFAKLMKSGKLRGGTDSTQTISEGRDSR